MPGRLEGKVALVVGEGQVPGQTIGNGRATTLAFAREGAQLAVMDKVLDAAEETVALVKEQGAGEAIALAGDVTEEADCRRVIEDTCRVFGQIDVLQNNVGIGIGIGDGDGSPVAIETEAWRHILEVNLTGMFQMIKQTLPVMQAAKTGVITNISSIVSTLSGSSLAEDGQGQIAYRVSKTGVNSLTESLAMSQAPYGIRVNAILPGFMCTPNAIEAQIASHGVSREAINELRDAEVPLRGKQGTAWDVANASVFLASEEAQFITGVLLPVDGGHSLKRG